MCVSCISIAAQFLQLVVIYYRYTCTSPRYQISPGEYEINNVHDRSKQLIVGRGKMSLQVSPWYSSIYRGFNQAEALLYSES